MGGNDYKPCDKSTAQPTPYKDYLPGTTNKCILLDERKQSPKLGNIILLVCVCVYALTIWLKARTDRFD